MLFAQLDGTPWTLGGIGLMCIGLMVKDWVNSHSQKKTEGTKVDQLTQQTILLEELVKQKKKARKQSLKCHRQTHEMLGKLLNQKGKTSESE